MALPNWYSAAPSCSGLAARGGPASRPRRAAASAAGLDPSPWGGLIGPATGGSENQGDSCAAVLLQITHSLARTRAWQIMLRQATSAVEIEQIQRISAMLGGTIAAGTMVTVITADGRKRAGKLVSHQAGALYGSIELATATRTDEINYLDIVWIAQTGRTGL